MSIMVQNLNQLMKLKINLIDMAIFHYETSINRITSRDRLINNMFYISSGHATYVQGDRQIIATAGDIVWLPQGCTYNAVYLAVESERVEGICLDFRMIDNSGSVILPPQDIRIMAHDHSGLYKKMYLTAFDKQLNAHGDFAFRADVYNIFAHLFNDVNRYSDSDGVFTEISSAIRLIEQTPQSNESIADLAAKCGISETGLRNKFKLYTGGKGPVEYRNYLRVEKAKELLQIGHYSMEGIAEMLGFYDASYFIKIFKSMTGITPNEFRKGKEI